MGFWRGVIWSPCIDRKGGAHLAYLDSSRSPDYEGLHWEATPMRRKELNVERVSLGLTVPSSHPISLKAWKSICGLGATRSFIPKVTKVEMYRPKP